MKIEKTLIGTFFLLISISLSFAQSPKSFDSNRKPDEAKALNEQGIIYVNLSLD